MSDTIPFEELVILNYMVNDFRIGWTPIAESELNLYFAKRSLQPIQDGTADSDAVSHRKKQVRHH